MKQAIVYYDGVAPTTVGAKLEPLYREFLAEDNLFHFMFEPEGIVIRYCREDLSDEFVSWLKNHGFRSKVEEYPGDENSATYCEIPFIWAHRDIFLPAFHASSLAALKLDAIGQTVFRERVCHIAHNCTGRFDNEEPADMIALGIGRMLSIQSERQNQIRQQLKQISEQL